MFSSSERWCNRSCYCQTVLLHELRKSIAAFSTSFFTFWHCFPTLTGLQQRPVTAELLSFSNFRLIFSCISVQALLNIPVFHMLLLYNLSSTLSKPHDLFMLMDFPCIQPDPCFSHSQLLLDVTKWSYSKLHAWVMALPALPVLQPWYHVFINGAVHRWLSSSQVFSLRWTVWAFP